MTQERTPAPEPRGPQLNPALQERLAEQRRAEVAAADRSRRLLVYGAFPAGVITLVVSGRMAVSDDFTTALIGQVVASTILFAVWAGRKSIAAKFQ